MAVGGHFRPEERAAAPPRVEDDPLGKRTPPRSHHDRAVLEKAAAFRRRKVQIERLQSELVEMRKQIVAPMPTKPAGSESRVYEIVVQP